MAISIEGAEQVIAAFDVSKGDEGGFFIDADADVVDGGKTETDDISGLEPVDRGVALLREDDVGLVDEEGVVELAELFATFWFARESDRVGPVAVHLGNGVDTQSHAEEGRQKSARDIAMAFSRVRVSLAG